MTSQPDLASFSLDERDIPNFIFLSHHERDRKTSPCTSVYQAFIGEDRLADLGGYVFLGEEPEAFSKALREAIDQPHPHMLFNGFQSLLRPNSITALSTAVANGIPVTIYWHETAWNLRVLAERAGPTFSKARILLQCLPVTNWVPTSQCLHSVATMMGSALDTFRIVHEIVDLKNFAINVPAAPKNPGAPLVIAGAGIPDERKGIDLFSYIAHTVKQVSNRPVEFRWYAATPSREKNDNVPYPKAVRWMGHHKDFQEALADVDIFVLTSRDDPSPLVVFEAMATGHPAFAFATTGFNEMLPREYVALDPDDMCRKLIAAITDFQPQPERFRALAEEFNVASFFSKAFRPRHSIEQNLPELKTEIVDFYSENDSEALDEKINFMLSTRDKLLTLMRSIDRQRVSLDAKGRRLEQVIKERDELARITRRVTSDLKIEFYREDRRNARNQRVSTRQFPFIKATPKKLKVLVIGNAPTVLQRELGNEIDQFDVVVRINNFRTKGFEKHVGTKTTYAVISPACMESAELTALSPSNVFVFGANMRDDYQKIKARLTDPKRGCHVVPPETNILKPSIYVDAMRLDMDFDLSETQWPSSGIVAVQWARDRHGSAAEVYVHGFDFYADSRTTLNRYFGVITKSDGKHDFDREKQYLHKLIDAGRIKLL